MIKNRNTRQKEIIEKEFQKTKTFFTAEELHKKVAKKDKKIRIATVYRFIKKKKKQGKVYSYLCNRRNIFSKGQKSHCHFTCEKTGKVTHFEINNLDFLKNKIPGSITSFQLEVKGICDDCRI